MSFLSLFLFFIPTFFFVFFDAATYCAVAFSFLLFLPTSTEKEKCFCARKDEKKFTSFFLLSFPAKNFELKRNQKVGRERESPDSQGRIRSIHAQDRLVIIKRSNTSPDRHHFRKGKHKDCFCLILAITWTCMERG